jgi:hypothetical protein
MMILTENCNLVKSPLIKISKAFFYEITWVFFLKIISLTLFRDLTVAILTARMHTEAGVSVAEFSRQRSYRSGFLLYFSDIGPFPPVYDIWYLLYTTAGFLLEQFSGSQAAS